MVERPVSRKTRACAPSWWAVAVRSCIVAAPAVDPPRRHHDDDPPRRQSPRARTPKSRTGSSPMSSTAPGWPQASARCGGCAPSSDCGRPADSAGSPQSNTSWRSAQIRTPPWPEHLQPLSTRPSADPIASAPAGTRSCGSRSTSRQPGGTRLAPGLCSTSRALQMAPGRSSCVTRKQWTRPICWASGARCGPSTCLRTQPTQPNQPCRRMCLQVALTPIPTARPKRSD